MKQNDNRYDDDFNKMLVDLYNTTNHTFKSQRNRLESLKIN
ncbi:hypothetical protein [Natronincola ferrireducens]|nr:hypothetical protein [Natronincola ferrireducens]